MEVPMDRAGLDIPSPPRDRPTATAVSAVDASGLPALLARVAPGPFGLSSTAACTLEALAWAVDLASVAGSGLEGLVRAGTGPGFAVPGLAPDQRTLVSAFSVVVLADGYLRATAGFATAPRVEGALDPEGLPEMLAAAPDPAGLARKVLSLARRYLELHPPHAGDRPDRAAASALAAFLELLRRSVIDASSLGALRPMVAALSGHRILVAGIPYVGLHARPAAETPSGLLPVEPGDVVGNDAYLEAGLRLSRDVAAFDFALRRNPKRLNPVLFGLGRPGCGKTLTAHAIGNDFLRYCRARDVPARFVVVRRTDWASSYQNASALNLVRIFREEVHAFDGVCGVYWPDIDTAFASRASDDLRMEEKQNLGAVFGVFDGTLLPRDGKWFLVCDANTMNMDEATVSRIAQNPFTVAGPTEPAHFARLMRDILLKDLRPFVPQDEAAWDRIGTEAAALGLSGRAIESVCGNVRARVQDFEFPDDYFRASGPERAATLARLSRRVEEADVVAALRAFDAFQREAAGREERRRFDAEVAETVRRLNVGKAAAERLGGE
jgi:hypothetical protein